MKAVQSMQAFQNDDFDGWGGPNDPLTTGLVEQIFQFYEREGDVQMLATMVCLLTLGRDRRSTCKHNYIDKCMLLPQLSIKDSIRFDNYLRQYADLLYSWGVLTKRNEVTKRVAYNIPQETVCIEPIQSKQNRILNVECSICCSSVRGASIFCPSCGHGGHLDHMISW